jgi:tryptophan-rich sensory protein
LRQRDAWWSGESTRRVGLACPAEEAVVPAPRQAFPIVWPILYADIAVVSASTLDQLGDQHRGQARTYAALLSTRTWQLNRDD